MMKRGSVDAYKASPERQDAFALMGDELICEGSLRKSLGRFGASDERQNWFARQGDDLVSSIPAKPPTPKPRPSRQRRGR